MTSSQPAGSAGALDRFFEITARGSTIGREVRGGLATFLAMSYIVVLVPIIMGTVPDGTGAFLGGGAAPDLAKVAVATSLVSGVLTIAMGVIGNFPMAVSSALGMVALLTFGIAAIPNMTWADAMGVVVIEGVILLILVLTGFREAIFRAVPDQLKVAISVGIGLFIALIGLVNSGIIRRGTGTPLELGIGGYLFGWPILVFLLSMIALFVMWTAKVRGAILYSILGGTVLAIVLQAIFGIGPSTGAGGEVVNPAGWGLTVPALGGSWFATPDFGLIGQFDLLGSWVNVGVVATLLAIFTLLLTNFFDLLGTMTAISREGNIVDAEGNVARSRRVMIADAIGAIGGGLGSTSSNSGFIESTVGVGDGARTGLANVVTGIGFLLTIFLAPLAGIIPAEAAGPTLVLVGFLMMQQVVKIDWSNTEIAIPAFMTIVFMPFSYSITNGIGLGFITFVLIKLLRGKVREIHPLLAITVAFFVVYFVSGPIQSLVTG